MNPPLPLHYGTLGAKVIDKAIKHSKYTVRLLRPGYLYTLEDRCSKLRWSGYKINARGQLYQFDIDEPAPSSDKLFECDGATCGGSAIAATIPNADEVPNFYLLYCTDPLTEEKLEEYKKNASAYVAEGKLQVIHPKEWVGGHAVQPHMIAPDTLAKHVLEYQLYDLHAGGKDIFNTAYAEALKDQLFPPLVYTESSPTSKTDKTKAPTLPAQFKRLDRIRTKMIRDKGVGVVLFDPIGITQELNNFRNDAFTRIDTFLKQTDKMGVSNERKLIVYNKIEEVQEALASGMLNKEKNDDQEWQEELERQLASARDRNDLLAIDHWKLQIQTSKKKYAGYIKQSPLEAKKKWNNNYEPLLNRNEMDNFMEGYEITSYEAQMAANGRANDHIGWLKSPELIGAFHTYDRTYSVPKTFSGLTPDVLGFTLEADLCFFGIDGNDLYDALLKNWIGSLQINANNLFMRSYCHNHQEIEKELQKAFDNVKGMAAKVKEPGDIDDDLIFKAFKKSVEMLKKIDSLFDEHDRNRDQITALGDAASKKRPPLETRFYYRISMITRAVFRSGAGGMLDKTLVTVMGGLQHSKLESLVMELSMDERTQYYDNKDKRIDKKKWELFRVKAKTDAKSTAGVFDKVRDGVDKTGDSLTNTIKQHYEKPQVTNNFHHTKISLFMGVLELFSLGSKVNNYKNDPKEIANMGASLFTLVSIGFDIRYNTLKTVRELPEYADPKTLRAGHINKATDIQRGGYKLWSGYFAAAAGVFTAIVDFMSIFGEGKKKKPDMMMIAIYFGRGATGVYTAYGAAKIGFSYAAAFLKHKGLGNTAAHAIAKQLSARVGLLLHFARFNMIGLAFTVVEILYLWLKDDELQKWCKQCTFRKTKVETFDYEHDVGANVNGLAPWEIKRTALTRHFVSIEEELEALNDAFAEVTGQVEKSTENDENSDEDEQRLWNPN